MLHGIADKNTFSVVSLQNVYSIKDVHIFCIIISKKFVLRSKCGHSYDEDVEMAKAGAGNGPKILCFDWFCDCWQHNCRQVLPSTRRSHVFNSSVSV